MEDEEFCLTVKNNVRFRRIMCGYTQTELAEMCHISKNQISNIEKEYCIPSVTTALMLSICLNCNFEDLFFLSFDFDI